MTDQVSEDLETFKTELLSNKPKKIKTPHVHQMSDELMKTFKTQ